MAKRLESRNIDPDTFLDSYRPVTVNSPPVPKAMEEKKESTATESPAQSRQTVSKKDASGLSAEAQEYLDRFVRTGADSGYKSLNTVYLTPEVHEMLVTVDTFLSESKRKRISAYVNNVLRDHFAKHYELIMEIVNVKLKSNPFEEQCKKN